MNEESISHNAGKVLLQIYLIWKDKNKVPDFKELTEITKIEEASKDEDSPKKSGSNPKLGSRPEVTKPSSKNSY